MTNRPETETVFPLPMSRAINFAFYLSVALSAGITAWSFASGFLWTGICLVAVGTPMAVLFWYMLHVNPSRAFILLEKDGITISAPPFVEETILFSQIRSISRTRLEKDKDLFPVKTVRGMRFASYRAGVFTLKNGSKAIIVANSAQVLSIKTDSTLYLIGPVGWERMEQSLSGKVV